MMNELTDLLNMQEEHNQLLYNIALQENKIASIAERLHFVKMPQDEHTKALDKLRLTREEVAKMEFEARRLENYMKRFELGLMFDEIEFNYLRERVDRALQNKTAKIAADEEDWRCRGCFKRGVCWGDTPVPKTCVTCQLSFPTEQGTWHCSKHDEEAVAACADYQRYAPLDKE